MISSASLQSPYFVMYFYLPFLFLFFFFIQGGLGNNKQSWYLKVSSFTLSIRQQNVNYRRGIFRRWLFLGIFEKYRNLPIGCKTTNALLVHSTRKLYDRDINVFCPGYSSFLCIEWMRSFPPGTGKNVWRARLNTKHFAQSQLMVVLPQKSNNIETELALTLWIVYTSLTKRKT